MVKFVAICGESAAKSLLGVVMPPAILAASPESTASLPRDIGAALAPASFGESSLVIAILRSNRRPRGACPQPIVCGVKLAILRSSLASGWIAASVEATERLVPKEPSPASPRLRSGGSAPSPAMRERGDKAHISKPLSRTAGEGGPSPQGWVGEGWRLTLLFGYGSAPDDRGAAIDQ